MIPEITIAADFLVSLARIQRSSSNPLKRPQPSEEQLQRFKFTLSALLRNRYREHWFPESPNKGSAYRCIRINGKMDPLIAQAGEAVGLNITILRSLLPSELTMWIDPSEVSYRIGENGSICVCEWRFDSVMSHKQPPPRQSPELFLDPRYEDVDPLVDFVL